MFGCTGFRSQVTEKVLFIPNPNHLPNSNLFWHTSILILGFLAASISSFSKKNFIRAFCLAFWRYRQIQSQRFHAHFFPVFPLQIFSFNRAYGLIPFFLPSASFRAFVFNWSAKAALQVAAFLEESFGFFFPLSPFHQLPNP